MSTPVVLYEQEYEQLKRVITRLCADANAKFVFLVDKTDSKSLRTEKCSTWIPPALRV